MSFKGLQLSRRRGMTLVEVVIATALASIVSVVLYGSAIYTMRQTARNVEHIYGTQLANSCAAKVRAGRFPKLTADPDTIGPGEFEKQFTEEHTIATDTNLDGSGNSPSTKYKVTYAVKGFGKSIEKISPTRVELTLPEQSSSWRANEFKDRYLVVTGGQGANQLMYIKNHQKSVGPEDGPKTVQVNLTKNTNGSGDVGWDRDPGSSSVFTVDYGLYCEITISWGSGQDYQSITETVYVPTG